MKSREHREGAGRDPDPVSLIQHIQLRPCTPESERTRLEKFARIVGRIIRSRFGMRSAELVDRYAEARVAVLEGEAKIKHAEAVNILASAAVKFSQARSIDALTSIAPLANDPPAGLCAPHKHQDRIRSAIEGVKLAIANLEKKGGVLEVYLEDDDSTHPQDLSAR